MFSTDKNIETIGQLIKLIKENAVLQKEYLKLDIIEKTVRLITALLLFTLFSMIVLAVLTYMSFAVAYALAEDIGNPLAFCIIAAFYVIILILFFLFRKKWIEKPLVKFIAGLLIE